MQPDHEPYEHHGAASLSFPAATTDQPLVSHDCRLKGWWFRETTGTTAATLRLIDGSNTTGQPVVGVNLAPGESTRDWLDGKGICIRTAVLVDLQTGTVEGGVWIEET